MPKFLLGRSIQCSLVPKLCLKLEESQWSRSQADGTFQVNYVSYCPFEGRNRAGRIRGTAAAVIELAEDTEINGGQAVHPWPGHLLASLHLRTCVSDRQGRQISHMGDTDSLEVCGYQHQYQQKPKKMCHWACVMCHVSCVAYHVSHIMCHMSIKQYSRS